MIEFRYSTDGTTCTGERRTRSAQIDSSGLIRGYGEWSDWEPMWTTDDPDVLRKVFNEFATPKT